MSTPTAPRSAPVPTPGARLLAALGAGSETRFVLAALAAGLVLRVVALVVALRTGHYELGYDEILVAQNLVAGRGFAFDDYGRLGGLTHVGAFFPPLPVWNYALLLRLFHSVFAIPWENVALSLACALALYALARRLFDATVARATLLLALVYPPFLTRIPHGVVVFPRLLLMVLLVIALHRLWTRARPADAAWSGLAAGLLALAMPDALVYFVAALAAFVALAPRAPRWRAAAAALAVAALVIAPWTIRNWTVFHRLCLVSTNGGFNFYMGNHAGASGEIEFSCISELDGALHGALARADEVGRDAIYWREGLAWIDREPGRAALSFVERAGQHWLFRMSNLTDMGLVPGRAPTRNLLYPLYLWSYAPAYVVVLVLAILGAARCRWRWGELTPVWLAFLYSTVVASVFVVQAKMRLVKVEPFLLILAAFFLVDLLRRRAGVAGERQNTTSEAP